VRDALRRVARERHRDTRALRHADDRAARDARRVQHGERIRVIVAQ
jgi:hypothetical protein